MGKKILITGFEPFDNGVTNPSGDWVTWMKNQTFSSDVNVQGIVLPVTFEGAFKRMREVFLEFNPDIVILTGLAQNRKELTIERIGINWVDARIPDNDGVKLLSQKINQDGPDGLFTTLDIDRVKKLIEKNGSSIKLSTTAGEYVCNDLLYKTLLYTQQTPTQVTFIHIPGIENYDGIYLALLGLVNDLA